MSVGANELKRFITCVQKNSTYNFSEYSENSLIRRIEKILIDNTCTFDILLERIRNDSDYLHSIVKQITVNTTELFRDPKFWQDFRHDIIPELQHKESITIWHVGCSTGQEVYSMLILLHELKLLERATVFASDINDDVIEFAQKGEYPYRFYDDYKEAFKQVIKFNPYGKPFKHTPFEKYFEVNAKKSILQTASFLKNKVQFFVHDLMALSPFTDQKFDIIFCRNVLIYFKADYQKKIYECFYHSLNPESYLVLGMQESMGWFMNSLFQKKNSVYCKREI
ncbi:MAG: methyltransferase domain-containing protein [Bacteroidales bacterium]|nr:methyltransferase domain-containing protein [Bacteroidales bacterium]